MLVEKTYINTTRYSYLLFWCFFFLHISGNAQESISGVVNIYTKVLAKGECPNQIQVADATGYTVGQRVLLLAMQGASMQEDNNGDFGQISDDGLSAGLYDWTTITNIQGNDIILEHLITTGYDFTQAVQLVGVPTYENAVVSAELSALPWDGNIGGVLALEVNGKLTLEANITASGLGFRGGVSVRATDDACNFLTNANRFFYEAGNWRGAPKGEGIVPIITGKEYGRGPQGNGGGGSNTHNAGGGGGSNLTLGGRGGENRDPAFTRCNGPFPGLGGFPLGVLTAEQHWFMGGGGGAGHRNNTLDASGGNGGGIIVVKAQELEFSGGVISSDGLPGGTTDGDGAGAGGAGGTIVLEIQNITGTAEISAVGGRGGDAENVSDRCMGPGGGGSGGQVYSNLTLASLTMGGLPGLSLNGSCPPGNNGATAGQNGGSILQSIKEGTGLEGIAFTALSQDTTICPGTALTLFANIQADEDNIDFQWFTNVDGLWVALTDNEIYNGVLAPELEILSLTENTQFQLVASSFCGSVANSEIILVSVDANVADPVAEFTFQLDGFSADFTNSSQGAIAYQWRITEIPFFSSEDVDPSFTFPSFGSYEVVLTAIGGCGGEDSFTQNIEIGGAPIAAFNGSTNGTNCAPLTVQWTDKSQGIFETYLWQFPGGIPASSQDPNPSVVYNTPGTYDVVLTVSGPLGSNTITRNELIEVFSVPQPEFSYQMNGLTVDFTSIGDTTDKHTWSFGDGATSEEKNPIHTFPRVGAYNVTLNLQTGGCGRSVTKLILLFPTGVDENELLSHLQLSPNPTSGPLRLSSERADLFPLDLFIFSPSGQLIEQRQLIRPKLIDIQMLPAGMYWFLIRSPLGVGSWKIIKQ